MTDSKKHRFYFKTLQSPTYSNVCRYLQDQGWQKTRFSWRADFGEKNFQFNSSAAQCLEFKHLLAQLVNTYRPESIPLTYCIDDDNWPMILNQLAFEHYLQDGRCFDSVDKLIWILKPSLLNNGQDIKLFKRLSELEQHFSGSDRLGGKHVLQKYMTDIHLLRGHKYSIRMFVVLTNYDGAYLYPNGYFNVSKFPYSPYDMTDLRPHLTNEHLREDEENIIQIPSDRFDFFHLIYPQIISIITATVAGLSQTFPDAFQCKKVRTLAIFGFDFLLDEKHQVWLLEANHAPCFPVSSDHPLQKYLYHDFWQDFIASFVKPIAQNMPVKTIKYNLFKRV